ncbi:CocE/NonD family hydrolase C-terminal non-catalytic domain-containing protein, partial [Hyunsoonleella pacifica]
REDDNMKDPTSYPDYPNPKSKDVRLYLTSGAPKAGGLKLTTPKQQNTETLIDNYSFSGEALANAELTQHRLLYVTPKLSKDIHISGVPKITVTLASSKPAAN